jgi:predicted transcriptional regulator
MHIMEKIRNMKIKEVMETKVGWLEEDDPFTKAVNVLCSSEVSMVPVRNKKDRLVGEVVQRDLLKAIIDAGNMTPQEIMFEPLLAMSFFPEKVHDVMRPIRLTFRPDDTVEYAARQMYRKQATLAPVIDKGKMVGIVSEDDLIRLLSEPVGKPACKVVKLKPEPL